MVRQNPPSRLAATPLALAVLVPLCCAAMIGPSAAKEGVNGAPRRTIVVDGIGEASGTPDIATTDLTVLRSAETARATLDAANAAMAEVLEAMKALGIAARDLQTSSFQIAPQYRYDDGQDRTQTPPVLVGYEVRNTLAVRIRDVGSVGAILDRAVTLGINQGGDIAFSIAEPATLRTEARRKAVEDARATAEALATAAGVGLGEVVSISVGEEAAPPMPMPMARMAMAAPERGRSVPVAAGENTVRASVRMVFEIGTDPR